MAFTTYVKYITKHSGATDGFQDCTGILDGHQILCWSKGITKLDRQRKL